MNGTQVRNLFYVKNLVTDTIDSDTQKVVVNSVSKPGDLKVIKGTNVKLSGKEYIQLQYVNQNKEVIVSDFVIDGQHCIKEVAGENTPLKKAVLSLLDAPVAGEDYIVDILVHNYQTLDENSVLAKFGAVHATLNMTKAEFMFKLAKSFVMNFRRDEAVNKFFKFHVCKQADVATPANWKEITMTSVYDATTYADCDYLIVEEVEQMTWFRGTFPKQTVAFDVAPHTIIANGDEVMPFETGESGLVAISASGKTVPNGYAMADLEYQCHGEIGDQLREVNYPRGIRTKYAITDADVIKTFDAVEICFHYVGRNTSPEKAEKQITLVVDHAGSVSTSAIVAALEA